uniref:MIP03566p n=1 Tax=Drosophila melanogaster TaxID=7227 RepID=C0PDD7_DROME|nr:MIP03566p [Drosophila melanogaster]
MYLSHRHIYTHRYIKQKRSLLVPARVIVCVPMLHIYMHKKYIYLSRADCCDDFSI